MRDHVARGGKPGFALSNVEATLNDQPPKDYGETRDATVSLPGNWTPDQARCLCGSKVNHKLTACFNLHPSLRPKGWKVKAIAKKKLEAARKHPTYSKFIRDAEEKVKAEAKGDQWAAGSQKGDTQKGDPKEKPDLPAVNLTAGISLQTHNISGNDV